jgi:hypothetical protein
MNDNTKLEIKLREMEQEILETAQEIERQKRIVRELDDLFFRRYAEHVLASYQEMYVAVAEHERLAIKIAELKAA